MIDIVICSHDAIGPPNTINKLRLNSNCIWVQIRGKWYKANSVTNLHEALQELIQSLGLEEWATPSK